MSFGNFLHFVVGVGFGWFFAQPLYDIAKKISAEFWHWMEHRK
jgi:hypothetical protein